MKKFSILALLAACALLIMPTLSLAAVDCGQAPVDDNGCPGWCLGDPLSQWCDGTSLCNNVTDGTCIDNRCQGLSTVTCGFGGQTGFPYCYCDSPNNCSCHANAKVDLLDFAAQRVDEGVMLTWKTGQEIECGAFKILRCKTAAPGNCELWSHMELGMTIPCEDNPNGADYSTVDTTANKDQSYSYYLREYDTTDRVFEYGPLFMAIDYPSINTGPIEPFESTFEILTAPSSGDDDDADEDDEADESEDGADDSDDSEGGCGC